MNDGVLLLAHGTPDSLDQIPEFLERVSGGRRPSPELVAEITSHYAAIGGRSPLTDLTNAQAGALRLALGGKPVYVGMRCSRPFVAEAVQEARRDGVESLLGLPLAPQYSTTNLARYREAVERALPAGLSVRFVDPWHNHPGLLDAFAEKAKACLRETAVDEIVFSAHSLPLRVIGGGDPYPQQVAATARGVAERLGLTGFRLAWQSAGRTPEPWLEPSLNEVLVEIARAGRRRVLVVPIGFVCDHAEILYDIDVEARSFARERGLELFRSESLNSSATLIKALAEIVRVHAG